MSRLPLSIKSKRSRRVILAAAIVCSLATGAALAADAPRGPSGIDLAGIDHGIKPGNDFDGYANEGWRKTAVIPADRSSTGVFLQVFQKAEARNAALIKGIAASNAPAGSDKRRIADYYAAFMDTAAIDKQGLAPLKPQLSAIDAITTRAQLATVMGAGLRADVDPINATNFSTANIFGLFVTQGLEDPSHSVPYLLQGGLGLPNRDYYLDTDKTMAGFRTAYLAYITTQLRNAGVADADKKAHAVFDLETKIAKAQESLVESEDVHKANNPWHTADFSSKAPGLDWPAYFKAAGLDSQHEIVVWQPSAITAESALVASEPLATWKALLTFHAINHVANLLPETFANASFEFYRHTLQGTPKQSERWKRALGAVNRDLGDAVGQLYVKQYFPASSKAEVQQMVSNILAAFDSRVDALDWMTASTKQKAKAKIASTHVGVGYPETWRNYADLTISATDPVGNHLRAELHEYQHQKAKLGAPVDRNEWWMTPQTVNAVNLPLQNALNFPAAILEAPFFDPKADPAANYGSIGAVIGHEISHSFDNTGAEFNASGKLANWWTPADQAHFKAATQKLVAQYSAYEALPGLHINGEQTLGENIADVSGLTVAYIAYHKSLGGKPAPIIEGLTGDQRFFLAFAQSWREKTRDAAMRAQVISDGHAPGNFRAQTVRNLDAWYDAFSPKPGETLYLAPADRVRIW
jgi:putative endopeptidase